MTFPSSIKALHEAWCAGQLAFEALYRELDSRITHDEHLGIWLARTPLDELASQARQFDLIPVHKRRDTVAHRPLLGVPVGIKDNICTIDLPTTAASKMLDGYRSPVRATVVERLLDAGALIVGKTNMDEFGMGSTGGFSAYFPTLHPRDPDFVPGGSSSGSAAALAAAHCMLALGSDTGGSVRQPAAHCGVWGLKPTYGAVSRHGLIAHASSLETIGPMAHNAADLLTCDACLRGHDPRDATSWDPPGISSSAWSGRALRIGLPAALFDEKACAVAMRDHLLSRLDVLVREGLVELEWFEMPSLEYASSVYAIMSAAQASSNLARYDGVRFGRRASQGDSPEELMRRSRTEGFGEEVQRRIMLGAHVLSASSCDAHMVQASRARTWIAQELSNALAQCDVLCAPVTSCTAPRHQVTHDSILERFLDDVLTVPANLAGLPALSFPWGELESWPVGAQLIGVQGADRALVGIAEWLLEVR